MMKEEMVILVDENDNELGLMEKLKAHKKGVLHRALIQMNYYCKKEHCLSIIHLDFGPILAVVIRGIMKL